MNDITPELVAQVATRLLQGASPNSPSIPQVPLTTPPSATVPTLLPPGPSPSGPLSLSSPGDPRGQHPQGMGQAASTPLAFGLGLPLSPPLPAGGVPHPTLLPVAGPKPTMSTGVPSIPVESAFVLPIDLPTQGGPVDLPRGWMQSIGIPASQSTAASPLPQLQPALGPSRPAKSAEPLGVTGFVQHIRSMSYRSDSGLCPEKSRPAPASLGISQPGPRPFDVEVIRRDFPALHQHVHGYPLAWFDNAATTQKPQAVIDAIAQYYARDNSNIHRGAHTLAARSTDAFEQARKKIQRFLGAGEPEEIVLVRGTTEGINLIAQSYGKKFFQPGDEIVLSTLEHHANIVPWQMIAQQTGAVIRVIPVNDRGEILQERYQALLGPKTKFVALTHASNSLGTLVPIAEMIHAAKRYDATVLIDGAQTVAHVSVNVQELGCDFFVFSGHKIFGPTGIGAVYARRELLEVMPPWQGGGNMIRDVTFEETTYSDPPAKFEAGTPNIADTVGLGAALDYVQSLGLENIAKYEHALLEYATEQLAAISGVRLVGTAREKIGVLSFVIPGRRPEDIGRLLDQEGIAVRAGHHCSQPSLRRFGLEATVRPSLAFYNTFTEVDRLAAAVRRIAE